MLNGNRPWTGPFVFILRGSVFLMGIINSFQLSQVLFLPGHSAPRQMTSIIQGLFSTSIQFPGEKKKTANTPQCLSRELLENNSKNIPFQ